MRTCRCGPPIRVRRGSTPAGPDVAVLQLAYEGPNLPVELQIADPNVVYDLQALPTAMLGFPGYDTASWPQGAAPLRPPFHPGVISRVSDFQFEGGVRPELAQMLQLHDGNLQGLQRLAHLLDRRQRDRPAQQRPPH